MAEAYLVCLNDGVLAVTLTHKINAANVMNAIKERDWLRHKNTHGGTREKFMEGRYYHTDTVRIINRPEEV